MFSNSELILIEDLKAGMILAEAVISDTGKILLESGLYLTENNIKKLIKWRTSYVSVKQPCKIDPLRENFLATYEKTLILVAEAFEETRAFGEVPIKKCEELIDNYIDLMTHVTGVISMLHCTKSHNEYTFGHSLNVAIIAGVLGKWLGFKGEELRDIILSGLLHDIGKMYTPINILDKPSKLTDEEMETIKTHPQHGYQLLSDCGEITLDAKFGILQHHERLDGSGYPQGLKGEDIHSYANIVAIADVYDAMSSKRVYRSQVPPFVVIEIIFEQMYDKLNPEMCLIFLTNIRKSMMGSLVLLSDGRQGKIIVLHDLLQIRPVIQLVNGDLIDLERNRQLEVVTVSDDHFSIENLDQYDTKSIENQ